MKLLTKEIEDAFRKQGDTSDLGEEEIRVIAKFFCPWAAARWFAVEYDPKDKVFFGYVNLGSDADAELGDFSLGELENLQGPHGFRIERDMHFPIGKYSLKEVMDMKGHLT
jgi:hypothetical protein